MTKEILDGQLPGKIVNAKHRKSIWITGASRLIVELAIPNKRFLRGGELVRAARGAAFFATQKS
jgi:hypothetical protein